ncbi:competence/damage-inducible protein A [Gudongella oleilytica]|jgi:nicotinamide-nucleotide amidase|uniref:competence/damage-inducible protein A n=1 Tax=Gudongella oleilytica TaxID=1582259 RepID=UPI002A35A35C|nr:competence/damage-inducible protein A [Gudongella oleilytica]MDY0255795.1 competence/damage-inducible protein A [Gudongella oleilytica]
MITEIIAVGTEITLGSIVNTNAVYLSKRLSEMGLEVCYHTSVDDDPVRLSSVFSIAVDRSDLIILTGGLGPTEDDLTKETIARVLGRSMISDISVEEQIKNIFTYSNRPMPSNNLKQARKPEGTEFIPNLKGTAPGIFIKHEGKLIVLLPGPPREMIPMFEGFVTELIKDDLHISIRSINTIGIGESALEEILREMDINIPDFTVNTYASLGTVEIKIVGKGYDKELLERNSKILIERLSERLGDSIYGFDNITIEEAVLNRLEDKNLNLAVAESVTGGEITRRITKIPGASRHFISGIIAYSEASKVRDLNVSEDTLEKYGAVSSETAVEMAKGLLNRKDVDIAISTTGFAGPSTGEGKPIGLVYICVADKTRVEIFERIFTGDRQAIQEKAASLALANLHKFLNNPLTRCRQ